MAVYVVTFEGAYGMQIAKMFTSRAKAEEYVAIQFRTSGGIYCYEIQEYWAE